MLERARAANGTAAAVTLRTLLSQRGGVFGVCNLVDVIPNQYYFSSHLAIKSIPENQAAWYMGGFALVLADVQGVPFVPCAGAPGLFGVHQSAYDQLELDA
jgi:hypothetical protein